MHARSQSRRGALSSSHAGVAAALARHAHARQTVVAAAPVRATAHVGGRPVPPPPVSLPVVPPRPSAAAVVTSGTAADASLPKHGHSLRHAAPVGRAARPLISSRLAQLIDPERRKQLIEELRASRAARRASGAAARQQAQRQHLASRLTKDAAAASGQDAATVAAGGGPSSRVAAALARRAARRAARIAPDAAVEKK